LEKASKPTRPESGRLVWFDPPGTLIRRGGNCADAAGHTIRPNATMIVVAQLTRPNGNVGNVCDMSNMPPHAPHPEDVAAQTDRPSLVANARDRTRMVSTVPPRVDEKSLRASAPPREPTQLDGPLWGPLIQTLISAEQL